MIEDLTINKKKKNTHVIKATLWAYASTYGGKFVVFLSTIVLARLLIKADFGLAGYALLVIKYLDVLSDLGIGTAIVYYRRDPKNNDTAFWLNIAIGLSLFVVAWIVAPMAGKFFDDPRSIPLTRVLALSFPIVALGNIQDSLMQKNLEFKQKFIPDLIKPIGKGLVTIILAFMGLGAWSIVIGQVSGLILGVIAYWIIMPWRPSLRFDWSIAKPLLSYGLNIVSIGSLATFLNNLDYLFVGRYLGAESLGIYTLAFRLPELLIKQVLLTAGRTIFPTFVKMRDNPNQLRRGVLTTIRFVSMITIPMAFGLAVISGPLILTLYTDKWSEAIPVMSAIALLMFFKSLEFNIGDVYKAQGRPDILTKLALIRVPFLVLGLWWSIAIKGSIVAAGWIQVLISCIGTLLSLIVAARLLKIPISSILNIFQPALISGSIMAGAVLITLELLANAEPFVQLAVGAVVGIIVYSLFIWWFQRDMVIKIGTSLRTAMERT